MTKQGQPLPRFSLSSQTPAVSSTGHCSFSGQLQWSRHLCFAFVISPGVGRQIPCWRYHFLLWGCAESLAEDASNSTQCCSRWFCSILVWIFQATEHPWFYTRQVHHNINALLFDTNTFLLDCVASRYQIMYKQLLNNPELTILIRSFQPLPSTKLHKWSGHSTSWLQTWLQKEKKRKTFWHAKTSGSFTWICFVVILSQKKLHTKKN